MNSTEFLAIRKLQQEREATDYEVAQFLDQVSAGNSDFEAAFEMAMIEVADDNYQPEGTPPLPAWCTSTAATKPTVMETARISRDEAEKKVPRDYQRGPVHAGPTEEELRLSIPTSGDLDSAIPF